MHEAPPSSTRATLVVCGLFAAGITCGAWAGTAAAARVNDPFEGLDRFARVLTTIENHYVDPIDPEHLVNAAVDGMVATLDPHSKWMSATDLATFREEARGSYEGIGIEVRRVPEGVLVAGVLPGGPAERDGLLPGDVIVRVGETALAGLDLERVGALLKGPRGTPVRLTLTRDGWDAPRTFTTLRDRVVTPAVTGERTEAGLGYARVHQFQDGAARELGTLLGRLQKDGPLSGLVLDLRDNPGGLLDEAVAVTDLFLDEGVIVSTRGRHDAEVHQATRGGVPATLPLVVLVNGLSASASEIVAGAVQDTGRGTLVGTHTYGKGSVQVLFENRDRSALRLTISRYYTPSGEPVAPAKGREPDVVVELPAAHDPKYALGQRIAGLEVPPDEREALLALLAALPDAEQVDPIVPWSGTVAERRLRDPQLDRALALLEAE